MPRTYKDWFSDLRIKDEILRRQAVILQTVLLCLVAVGLCAVPIMLILPLEAGEKARAAGICVSISLSAVFIIWFLRRGRFRLALVSITLLALLGLLSAVLGSGVGFIAIMVLFPLVVTLMGLLGSRVDLMLTTLACFAIYGVGAWREGSMHDDFVVLDNVFAFVSLLGLLSVLVERFGATLKENLAKLQDNETRLSRSLSEAAEFNERLQREIRDRAAAEEQRNRLEAELFAAQKMESLGRLAGGVSHDFNNLMTAVLGNASILQTRSGGDPAAKKNIDGIIAGAERARELCGQLLAYSGKRDMKSERVRLTEVVQEMARLMEVSLPSKAELGISSVPNLPSIKGDAGQIRQVILNLLTNAADALEAGPGRIQVRVGRRYFTDEEIGGGQNPHNLRSGEYTFLEVEDTGRGMPEEIRVRIFEPFFTTKVTGHGIGLAGVLGIVRSHGGAIAVRSTPGEGTRITIFFPDASQTTTQDLIVQGGSKSAVRANPALPGSEPAAPPSGGETDPDAVILVVDDEELIREFVCMTLELTPYQSITAEDGLAGRELFEKECDRIRAVILDYNMPGMDGERLARAIRSAAPGMPIILVSGFEEATRVFRDDPRYAFLRKPFGAQQLIETLEKVTGAEAGSLIKG